MQLRNLRCHFGGTWKFSTLQFNCYHWGTTPLTVIKPNCQILLVVKLPCTLLYVSNCLSWCEVAHRIRPVYRCVTQQSCWTTTTHLNININWTSSAWWHHGFLQISAVAFLLFLAPAGGSNPAGQSLTLT